MPLALLHSFLRCLTSLLLVPDYALVPFVGGHHGFPSYVGL